MAMEVKQAGQELVLRRIPDASLPRADAGGRAVETTLALGSPRPRRVTEPTQHTGGAVCFSRVAGAHASTAGPGAQGRNVNRG